MTAAHGSRRARVLQIVLSLHPGGTERLVVELAKRLHDRIPAMVCCLDEKGTWSAELDACGIPVRALGRPQGFRPSLGRRIAGLIDEHGATVIHAHHYSPFVYGALARLRRPSCRLVFTEHGRLSDAPPSAKRRLANWMLRAMPDKVFCVSDNLRQHVAAEGFGTSAVGVIYNGIDVGPLPAADTRARLRGALGLTADTFLVGTIARLDPVKDLETMLRALAHPRLLSRAPTLIVVGDGPERAALEALASALGLAGRVHFAGHRDDAREWLAACDAYANSSISEGVSLTILEAMAASLPIVATAVGGTPEVVNDTCGRLVPARDPGAIAEALSALIDAPPLRAALGSAARQRVEAEFTLDRMVREYRDVYERLL